MAHPGSGVAFQPGPDRAVEYLPLEELRVTILIIDVTARVTLTQVYSNESNHATPRCKYIFPVPASAAVCAFEMQTSDGRSIIGVSKHKDQAREQYEEALQAGQSAALATYVSDDTFTISIGTLRSRSTAQIKLTYVMTLSNDDNIDEVRFQLPMGVGERYGTPSLEIANALSPTSRTRIRIKADIQMCGKIQEIRSPSHPEITQTNYPTHQGRESRRRRSLKYRSASYLDRDFVLVIQSDGLDAPRCFAELRQDMEGRDPTTIAMQLSLVPRHSLPLIDSQEYLFLIDQSGSMSGGRIEQAKQTVNLLLRMLPTNGTVFNVFSFSNSVTEMWPQSRVYNQESLTLATEHVDFLVALGGTEICRALQHVLQSRNREIPTATFVLTDGAVHESEAQRAISFVAESVASANSHAPLRVFTLGIGNEVSTATCEGIARAGHGACLLAVNAESILGRCARLFVAGRTPFVENISVDWGVPVEHLASVATVAFQSSRTVAIRPLPVIQQAPSQIYELHSGTRMNVSVIITLRTEYAPKEVILRGQLKDVGTPFVLTIPIKGLQLSDTDPRTPPIHTLAAWRLIQELQEGRVALPASIDASSTQDEIREAVIVQLGEKYQLVSKYTSFVAIDPGQQVGSPNSGRPRDFSRQAHRPDDDVGLMPRIQDILSSIFGLGIRNVVAPALNSALPGAWPDSQPVSEDAEDDEYSGDDNDNDDDGTSSSAETFSTLSSLESYGWSDWSTPPSPQLNPISDEEEASPSSPRLEPLSLAPDGGRQRPGTPPPPVHAPPPSPDILNLFRLQTYNGSFPLNEDLTHIIGSSAVQQASKLQVAGAVWATALSVAFIRKHMANQTDLLYDLLVKAEEYLGSSGVDIEKIMIEAEKWIS